MEITDNTPVATLKARMINARRRLDSAEGWGEIMNAERAYEAARGTYEWALSRDKENS